MEPRKFVSPEYLFGIDTRLMAASFCKQLGGKRILLVTDKNLLGSIWFKEIEIELQNKEIEYYVYSTVSPNPRDYEVMDGAVEYKNHNCNLILALGGGSVMDCAKGIGIVSSDNKHIHDFEGVDKILKPIPPLVCIPTTAGSAADVSQFAIINNTQHLYKFAIISKTIVPDVALIDPVVLTTKDKYLTACTGMDALSHAFEAYVSNASSPFTDLYAIEAVKLISANLHDCISTPENLQSRGKVMLACLYAGLAFSNASLGCVHSMAHSLGGYLDLAHGECNAILLPHVVDYNFNNSSERYKALASCLLTNEEIDFNTINKQNVIDQIISFKNKLNINSTLKDKGVTSDILSQLSIKAINDPCNATNPRTPNKKDLEIIYSEAM